MDVKQVIVMRKDLRNSEGNKVRTGKLIAQACHASIGALLNFGMNSKFELIEPWENNQKGVRFDLTFMEGSAPYEWITGTHTKVCVGVDSEEELIAIYESIPDHIPCYLVTDAGLTEFNGVATKTCLAIGPAPNDEINKITCNLKLL